MLAVPYHPGPCKMPPDSNFVFDSRLFGLLNTFSQSRQDKSHIQRIHHAVGIHIGRVTFSVARADETAEAGQDVTGVEWVYNTVAVGIAFARRGEVDETIKQHRNCFSTKAPYYPMVSHDQVKIAIIV